MFMATWRTESLHRTMAIKIAIGSIFIECNQLGGVPTDIGCFERCELWRGPEVLEQSSGVVGGILGILHDCGAEIAPLLVATACPSGVLTAECYAQLKGELLDRLRGALPVDGLLLALHGAAAAEDAGDLEGDLLTSVREITGPDLPVVVTLDLHAHITAPMVQLADALIAWETYPHRDAFTTGERGARMILDIIEGKVRPVMAMAKVPVLVGSVHGNTEGQGPFADIMRRAKNYEGRESVLSTSILHVYPYLDLPDLGCGALVITDNEIETAEKLAVELAELYWSKRFEMEPEVFDPVEAIRRGLDTEGGPILLVETADCCGGGAAGDSVATLKGLLKLGIDQPCLVPVVDPEAAQVCHRYSIGDTLSIPLGHRRDPRWGSPIEINGELLALSDGRFKYSGGIWDGQVGEMGPSAVLKAGHVEVLVMSNPTYDWADEQFRSVGMAAVEAKFVVVKNPMNFRVGYRDMVKAAYILDTPGPTPATLRGVTYANLKRPYFPADEGIPGLKPVVLTSL
jgi:microcystin degradation protein MlrC